MSYLSATDALEYLCYELPSLQAHDGPESHDEESSGLLSGANIRRTCTNENECVSMASFAGLSTLEIAILADAKKFLAHRPVSFASITQLDHILTDDAGTTYGQRNVRPPVEIFVD